MKLKEGLQVWAERWRGLKAWGRPLEEVTVEFRQRHAGNYATGLAFPTLRRIVVTAPDMTRGLTTLLHELAHVAVPGNEHHGTKWREAFVGAVTEVTGVYVTPVGSLRVLGDGVRAAVASWWKTSGNEFAWGLVRDRKAS